MIRQATLNDLEAIWQLRLETSALLKTRNIDQWQYDQPDIQTFINDVNSRYFYIYEYESIVIGMISIQEKPEDTYQTIYGGKWIVEDQYFTIHRLAVKKEYLDKGISKALIMYAEKLAISKNIFYIRIDTHINNHFAIRLFESLGYQKRGYILLNIKQGDPSRIAYDKILK